MNRTKKITKKFMGKTKKASAKLHGSNKPKYISKAEREKMVDLITDEQTICSEKE